MAFLNGVHDEALLRKGEQLKKLGFKGCVHRDGFACAGAGKVPQNKACPTIKCGNQNGKFVTPAESRRCTKRTARGH